MTISSATHPNAGLNFDLPSENTGLNYSEKKVPDSKLTQVIRTDDEKPILPAPRTHDPRLQNKAEQSLSLALVQRARQNNQTRIETYEKLQNHPWVKTQQYRLEITPDILSPDAVDFKERLDALKERQRVLATLEPKLGETFAELEKRAGLDLNSDNIVGNAPNEARVRISAEGFTLEHPKDFVGVSAQFGSFGDVYYRDVPISINAIALEKKLFEWHSDGAQTYSESKGWSSPVLSSVPMATFITGSVPLGKGISVIGGPWSIPDAAVVFDSGSVSVDGVFAGITYTPLKAPDNKVAKKTFTMNPGLVAAWLSGDKPAAGGFLLGGWGVGKTEIVNSNVNAGFTPYARTMVEYDFSKFEDSTKVALENMDDFNQGAMPENFIAIKNLDRFGKLLELGISDERTYRNVVVSIAQENNVSVTLVDKQMSAFLIRQIEINNRVFGLPGAAVRLQGQSGFNSEVPPSRPGGMRSLADLYRELERVDKAIIAERQSLRESPPAFDPDNPKAMDVAFDTLNQLAGNEALGIVGEKTKLQQTIYALEYEAMLNKLQVVRSELKDINEAIEQSKGTPDIADDVRATQQRLINQHQAIETRLLENDHGWTDIRQKIESVRAFLDNDPIPNWEMEKHLEMLILQRNELLNSWFKAGT